MKQGFAQATRGLEGVRQHFSRHFAIQSPSNLSIPTIVKNSKIGYMERSVNYRSIKQMVIKSWQ
jgi:hypothetical protein